MSNYRGKALEARFVFLCLLGACVLAVLVACLLVGNFT